MGILIASKTISPGPLKCNELGEVTLSLTASPDITQNPVDIILVLDRSGSMSGAPLAALKAAAIEFIDIIKDATNPGNPGATNIGIPNRIGMVSFSDNATLNVPLTQNVASLNAAINALVAGGRTNHQAAFDLAAASYSTIVPPNRKVMIMFTDGDTTAGGNADIAAANARAAGIEIYSIGLGSGINVSNLNNWSTDPDASHVIIAPTPAELEAAFRNIAENISKPGAVGITVVDTLEDEFEIIGTPILQTPATTAANYAIDPTLKTITWTLDQLGISATEGATITFNIKYLNCTSATLPVNRSVVYTDENLPPSQVTFTGADGTIIMDCDAEVTPDCCLLTQDVSFDPCETMIDMDLPNPIDYYDLKCDGRILSLGVRLQNICPGRRVALGVIATELIGDMEYSRGFRALTVPAQQTTNNCPCTTLVVKPIIFIFTEDTSPAPDVCDTRLFRIRLIAHYIDTGITDFNICPTLPPPVPV